MSSNLWGIPEAISTVFHDLADYRNPNKTYGSAPFTPAARDNTTGRVVPALPPIVRDPLLTAEAIIRGQHWWEAGNPYSGAVASTLLGGAGGLTARMPNPMETMPTLYEPPPMKPQLVINPDNMRVVGNRMLPADTRMWNPETNQPTWMEGRPVYDPILGYRDPLGPQFKQGWMPPPEPPSNVVPFPTRPAAPPAAVVVDETTHPPGSSWMWNTNLKDWKSKGDLNKPNPDKEVSFNAIPTGQYDAKGNVQVRLIDPKSGVEYPPAGNNWVHHSELTPGEPPSPGGSVPPPPTLQGGWQRGDPQTPLAFDEYIRRLQSPDGGLTPPYDDLFYNKGSNRYAGVYDTERLPSVLDQLESNFPGRQPSLADLYARPSNVVQFRPRNPLQ